MGFFPKEKKTGYQLKHLHNVGCGGAEGIGDFRIF